MFIRFDARSRPSLPLWEFHRSSVMLESSSSANWSGMYQEEWMEGIEGGGGGLRSGHSSSLFLYTFAFRTSLCWNHTPQINAIYLAVCFVLPVSPPPVAARCVIILPDTSHHLPCLAYNVVTENFITFMHSLRPGRKKQLIRGGILVGLKLSSSCVFNQ